MKGILLALSFGLLPVAAHGQDFGFDSHGLSLGVVREGLTTKLNSTTGSLTSTLAYTLLTVGGFLDFRYLLVGVSLESEAGDAELEFRGSGGSNTERADADILNAQFTVLAKYPIIVEGATLFAAAGLEYVINLDRKGREAMTEEGKSDLNDLFLDLGGGADFPLSEASFLRASVTLGLNVTARSDESDRAFQALNMEYSPSGFRFGASVGLGFRH